MIKDRLENAGQYLALHEKFKEGFAFTKGAVKELLPVGKYILDGEDAAVSKIVVKVMV